MSDDNGAWEQQRQEHFVSSEASFVGIVRRLRAGRPGFNPRQEQW
jgi:hypothetical protein